jgi:predicted small lipoprotein YifL
MHSHTKALFILLFSLIFIAGCGQKGQLFLPGNTNEVSTSIPQQSSGGSGSEAEDDEDDKKPISIN